MTIKRYNEIGKTDEGQINPCCTPNDNGRWCLYSDVDPIIAERDSILRRNAELEESLTLFGEIPETGSLDCCAEFLKDHNCGCELVVINWLRRIASRPVYGPGSDLRHCPVHQEQE